MAGTRTKSAPHGTGYTASTRQRRAERVDMHCHCLPGLDDGPIDLPSALSLCHALVRDGVSEVIATPHQLGRYAGRVSAERIRAGVDTLQAALDGSGIELRVWPGGEVRLDERLAELVSRGEILTLADSRWLLLELPGQTYIDPAPLIQQLAERGVGVIISHPERYGYVLTRPDRALEWIDAGAALQLTSAGVCGELGPRVQELAGALIDHQAAHLVASDAHDLRRRRPMLSKAFAYIHRQWGGDVADRLCIENPGRVLEGRAIGGVLDLKEGGAAA